MSSYTPNMLNAGVELARWAKNFCRRTESIDAKDDKARNRIWDECQTDELDNRLHRINDLSKKVNSLFRLYLDANDGYVYLGHWSRDCDCVEGHSVRRIKPLDDDGNRRSAEQMSELIDEIIGEENEWADGPFSIYLINKAEYDEFVENPAPSRDRIMEAFEDGNPSPFCV